MTQFVLISSTNIRGELEAVIEQRSDLSVDVAQRLFPNTPESQLYILESEGNDIDSLALKAQIAIQNGLSFEETTLYQCSKKNIKFKR